MNDLERISTAAGDDLRRAAALRAESMDSAAAVIAAARRRARLQGAVAVAVVLVLGSVLVSSLRTTTPAPVVAPPPERVAVWSGGTVELPQGWSVAPGSLLPNGPPEAFVASTAALPVGGERCAQVPTAAMEALGPADALVMVQTLGEPLTGPPDLSALSTWPSSEENATPVRDCPENSRDLEVYWLLADEAGGGTWVLAAFGREVDDARRSEALAVVRSYEPPRAGASERPATPEGTSTEAAAEDAGTPPPRPEGPPSQSVADAERDGVISAVAELTFTDRIELAEPIMPAHENRVVTDEGVWIISRMPRDTYDLSDGCGLGATDDPDAVYRRDVICTVEYGEVLLLDHEEERILRAYPMPGLPPKRLLVTDEAVWCAAIGDGGLPDSALCRIDRTTLAWTLRVFPHDHDAFTRQGDARSGIDPETGTVWLPEGWTVHEPPHDGAALTGTWTDEDGWLVARPNEQSGDFEPTRYDPTTLRPEPAD